MQFSFRNQFGKGKRIVVLNVQRGSLPQRFYAHTLTDFLVCLQDQKLCRMLTSTYPCIFLEFTTVSYHVLFLKSLILSLDLEELSLSRLSNVSRPIKSHQVTICICPNTGKQK